VKNSQEILSELLAYLKISANKLASEIGLKANTSIYYVKNGRNNISPDLAKKITNRYPKINYNWLLTGEGEVLKSEYAQEEEKHDSPNVEDEKITVKEFHDSIKRDLKALSEGMTHNFEVVSNGLITSLQGQRKILDFIEKLNAEEISKATSKLDELLKERK
jgi:plasmid maintenance system antidote protein VapI